MSEEEKYESEMESLRRKQIWHDAVALRAYRLWQHKGMPQGISPDGRTWADHFWLHAEAQMLENGFG
jgi:hypothetical protein